MLCLHPQILVPSVIPFLTIGIDISLSDCLSMRWHIWWWSVYRSFLSALFLSQTRMTLTSVNTCVSYTPFPKVCSSSEGNIPLIHEHFQTLEHFWYQMHYPLYYLIFLLLYYPLSAGLSTPFTPFNVMYSHDGTGELKSSNKHLQSWQGL